MKSNLKWFFKITTIISYLKITSKFKEKGPLESLKGKVISNSSFMPSNFLCVAINLEKKTNHLFLETKITKYVLQLYIYTATFYGFHMLSKLFKVSVWDPTHLPSDCCWNCNNTKCLTIVSKRDHTPLSRSTLLLF